MKSEINIRGTRRIQSIAIYLYLLRDATIIVVVAVVVINELTDIPQRIQVPNKSVYSAGNSRLEFNSNANLFTQVFII